MISPRHVEEVTVHRAIDADTIDILPATPTRLRLLGFDAAEIRGASDEEEAIGAEQTMWILQWLQGRRITCDGRGTDNFGRVLAWIVDAYTGECLNLEFVKRWPERARNPRHFGQKHCNADVSIEQYKP